MAKAKKESTTGKKKSPGKKLSVKTGLSEQEHGQGWQRGEATVFLPDESGQGNGDEDETNGEDEDE